MSRTGRMLKEGPRRPQAHTLGGSVGCMQTGGEDYGRAVGGPGWPSNRVPARAKQPALGESSHTLALSFLFLILGNLSGHWLTTVISEK